MVLLPQTFFKSVGCLSIKVFLQICNISSFNFVKLNFEKTNPVSGEDLIKFALYWMSTRRSPSTTGRLSGATTVFKKWPGGKKNEMKALIISDDEDFLEGRTKQKEIILSVDEENIIKNFADNLSKETVKSFKKGLSKLE